jgi:hypothetical protein
MLFVNFYLLNLMPFLQVLWSVESARLTTVKGKRKFTTHSDNHYSFGGHSPGHRRSHPPGHRRSHPPCSGRSHPPGSRPSHPPGSRPSHPPCTGRSHPPDQRQSDKGHRRPRP